MKEDKYNNIEELLPRYYDGLTTEKETQLVEEWVGKDAENHKIMNHIQMLHLATDTLYVMQSIDMEKAFEKVNSRIDVKKASWLEWSQRIAALLFIPLFIGALIMYTHKDRHNEIAQIIEIKTNPGMTTSVMLPDSTLVHLNSESTLRYPIFFSEQTREVELIGEAYFDVAKDKKKRFVISMSHQSQIEVYGTSFNVEAYANENQVSTTLVEGQIAFLFKDKEGELTKIKLEPNHKLIYNSNSRFTRMIKTSCEVETAWKDGQIIFDNTTLDDILNVLSKRFNIDFVVTNNHLKEYSFTGTFTTQRLDRILEYFKRSSHMNWRYLDSDEIKNKKQKIEIY